MFPLLRDPRRSLRVKIIAWSFVPTTIILLAVALVTFYAYQKVAEDLVVGRNRELTRLSAGRLAVDLSEYTGILASLARNADIHEGGPLVQQSALSRARNLLMVFDAGVVIVDSHGRVAATEPERPDILGRDWSDRGYFRQMLRSGEPVFSDVVADGPQGAEVVVVAVPITGSQGEFRGTMAGMFRLGATAVSAFYGGIVKLRIGESGSTYLVDAAGRVIYHSDVDLVGRNLSETEVVRQALSRKMGEIWTPPLVAGNVVASFAPVPGTPWVLIGEESWSALMSSSRTYGQFLLLLLVLGVVVPALVVTLGVRRITGPIAKLIAASKAVAAGSFGRTITVRTGDELEELATQFNLMSARLQESYAGLEKKVADRTRELATLNAIAAVVSRSLDLQDVLRDALEKTLQSIGIKAGGIYLLDEKSETLSIAAHRGLSPQFLAQIDGLRAGEGFSGHVARTGQPLVVPDVSADPRLARRVPGEEWRFSLVSVPLSARGKVLGTLFATADAHREFAGQDVQLLISIGNQIGVAIENALLYQRAQQLAVMEERNRLARDLHDSVTQAVYGVTLYAEAAARLLSSGQVAAATSHLHELRSTAQQALREMRCLIFELRPPVLEKEGLLAALQARLEAVEGRSGLQTELKVEGDAALAAEVEDGLYRISQEALNNALKHAKARSIRLSLLKSEELVALEVADDGVGFDLATAEEHGGLGLCGMRERAARLGGRLTVQSRPGEGTIVRVEVSR